MNNGKMKMLCLKFRQLGVLSTYTKGIPFIKHLKFALVLGVFIPLFALSVAGEASAQQPLNVSDRKPCKWISVDGIGQSSPDCLNESDIKPCEALLAKTLPDYIEKLKMSLQKNPDNGHYKKQLDKLSGSSPLLEYALNQPPYSAPYDLKDTKLWIKKEKEIIAILQSGDEKEMRNVIGVTYQGKKLEARLAHDETFLCMLNVRLAQLQSEAKLDRKNPANAAVKQSGKTSAPPRMTMAPGQDPSIGEGGGGPNPPAPTPRPPANKSPGLGVGMVGVPISKLTSAQIAACSDEIRRTQLASQSWGGDVNDVAARLGRFQQDLFEGRCAGHPEAQAYIAGANKMLGYGGNAAGSGKASPPPLASAGSSSGSGSTDPSRSRKIHNPAADAKSCTQLIQDTTRQGAEISGRLRFVNKCPTAVEFFWCSDAECMRDSGNTWTIHVGGGWPVSGTDVRWGACRGANSGGFDKGSQGLRYTCPNLKW